MKQDKFLIGILIGIGALVVLALTLFFTRQGKVEYMTDATPEGVTHNYLLALVNKDYQKAYGYLAGLDNKPTYEEFRQSFLSGNTNPDSAGADVGAAQIDQDVASVELTVYYSYNDPFSANTGSSDRSSLVLQDGVWKITYMPYSFWGYDWYQMKP